MHPTLIVLTLAQCLAQTGAPMVVLLGGIIGAGLAPSPGLATLPLALMIVGTASTTVPAALLMRRFGRKPGFIFAAGYASLGGLLAAYAVTEEHFVLFCCATFLIGSHNAFIQQYRFALTEVVPTEKLGRYLSILMLAGVVAAYIGPELATQLKQVSGMALYAGSFIGLSFFMLGAMMVLCFYQPGKMTLPAKGEQTGRALLEIARQVNFKLALGAAVAAWSIMSLLMTATPLSMHNLDLINLEDTAWVIQSHIMAMFLPSLFSGILVDRFGPLKIIGVGAVILLACLLVAWGEPLLLHYWWSMVLLGVGWNFMFLGGTTLLTTTYRQAEQFKVQATNDFVVFSLQGLAALSSGFLLMNWGWDFLVYLSLPFLLVPIVLMFRYRSSFSSAVTD